MKKASSSQNKLKTLIVVTFFLITIFNVFGFIISLIMWAYAYRNEIKHFLEQKGVDVDLRNFSQTNESPKIHNFSNNFNLFNQEIMNILKKIAIWGGLAIFALIVITSTFVSIENGTVGVVTRFGEVQEKVMKPGLNVKIPFADHVLVYNTQKIIYETSQTPLDSMADYTDYPIDTTTEDGQQIQVTYSVRFSVNPDKVTWLANNLGTEEQIVEKVVKTDTRINTRNVPRQYKAIDLYTGNVEEVSEKIAAQLEPLFEENGLYLDEFGIRNVVFSNEYTDAIESKQIEAEKIVTEQNIAEQEKYKKQAAITKAEGEAEAQRLQQQTITNELLKKMWIEKWNGELPTYQGGDNAALINLPD